MKRRGRRRRGRRRRGRRGQERYGTLWFCMELGICMETLIKEVFVWILVVPFLGFS